MKKIKVEFEVNETDLLSVSECDSFDDAIRQELGWLNQSGIFFINWEEIKPTCDEHEEMANNGIMGELKKHKSKADAENALLEKGLPLKISLQDTSCLQQFEMWGKEEWSIEGDGDEVYLNFYLPIVFDVDKAFGLHVNTDENDDYINVYLNWYPYTDKVELVVCYMAPDADEAYDVEMSDEQIAKLKAVLPEICKAAYGATPRELWCKENKRIVEG